MPGCISTAVHTSFVCCYSNDHPLAEHQQDQWTYTHSTETGAPATPPQPAKLHKLTWTPVHSIHLHVLLTVIHCVKVCNLDSLHWFSQCRSRRPVLCARCVRCDVSPACMALFTFCVITLQNAAFWGLRTLAGGYDPQIQTRSRFLYDAPTPQVSLSCVYSFGLSEVIVLTNTPTDKQTPLKTSNVISYATMLDNYTRHTQFNPM